MPSFTAPGDAGIVSGRAEVGVTVRVATSPR